LARKKAPGGFRIPPPDKQRIRKSALSNRAARESAQILWKTHIQS